MDIETIVLIAFLIFLVGMGMIGINCAQYESNDSKFSLMEDKYYFSPCYIYKNTEMNVIGCLLFSLVLFLTNYLYCTGATLVYIVYTLTHIGRKKEK